MSRASSEQGMPPDFSVREYHLAARFAWQSVR